MNKSINYAIMTLFSALLVSCGGGGSGGSSNNSSNTGQSSDNNSSSSNAESIAVLGSKTGLIYSSSIKVQTSSGIAHSTGIIPFDINGDNITDIILMPSNNYKSPELNALSIVNNNDGAVVLQSVTGSTYTSGWVKDWAIEDLNGDKKSDIAWVDHGLEIPNDFQYGYNASLLSSANGFIYSKISTERKFNHGLAIKYNTTNSSADLIVADFNDWLKYYSNNGSGKFTESQLPLNGAFNYANPGAVANVRMKDGSTRIVAASYKRPNPQWDSRGFFITYELKNNTLIQKSIHEYNEIWKNKNIGAFAIVPFDANGSGYDDLIILGEGEVRSVVYYKQTDTGFIDATAEQLGSVVDKITIPDKIIAFDANSDGLNDIFGFSYKNDLYTSGSGLFINQGGGVLKSAPIGISDLADTLQVPIFTTYSDGKWKKFIGLYGLKLISTQSITVKAWIK